jgi:ubiquinone/menaquinone biosynthesis C-methylase UbiE
MVADHAVCFAPIAQGRTAAKGARLEFDFLIVDDFLRDVTQARALKTAFELRLIDRLLEGAPASAAELAAELGKDARGLQFLTGLLLGAGVLDLAAGRYRLHARFLQALEFRDLLEAKLDFAGFVAPDLIDLFTAAIADPAAFQKHARLFRLFDYRRAMESTHENYEHTASWMRLTSALTRYEARACLQSHDFSRHARMLDVGGNSGEFALQACRAHPGLRATVMDLPVVCAVGAEHVLPHEERSRIGFLPGDVRRDPLPAGHDLITFKSMLHDWPEAEALRFLDAAAAALEPGGTLLVFERLPLDLARRAPPFGLLPALLFFRSYRPAAFYRDALAGRGLVEIAVREVALDVPFLLVSARKAA